MPLYFAYGSNLDIASMARRCPASHSCGPARLFGYRFTIMASGYASVRSERHAVVHGLLWHLALADVPALDRYEEIGSGLYRKTVTSVIADPGPRQAVIYRGCSTKTGYPTADYIDLVVSAAERCGFPRPYLDELRRWRTPPGSRVSAEVRRDGSVAR